MPEARSMIDVSFTPGELMSILAAFQMAKLNKEIRLGQLAKTSERKVEIALKELSPRMFKMWDEQK